MNPDPSTVPGEREPHPAGAAPRWGVSSLDYHTHAVDADAEHTDAVYVARCGQLLFRSATLYEEPPLGSSMCLPCLRYTEREDTSEVTEPHPARPATTGPEL